ncbi:MAG: DUF1700 domain-containing protein [Planctomycetota bacterium]|jgi:hypothetical protein
MESENETKRDFGLLPACAKEYIKQVLKKMRYRKKVRQDVQAELEAHFEDELKDCKTDEEKKQKAQQLIADFGDVKLLAVLLRRAKKRCRPLWRTIVARTLQTVGVSFLFLILYAVWFSTGRPTISIDYLALLNQMNRPEVLDEDNAWPYYEKAIELYIEPDRKILELTACPREEFKIGLRFSKLNKEKQNKILEWLEQNESHWDNFDLSQKLLIRKCFQEGLVPLPIPYPFYRKYPSGRYPLPYPAFSLPSPFQRKYPYRHTPRYRLFDAAIDHILRKIERRQRIGRREPSSEYEMMMEMSALPAHRRRDIELDPDDALNPEIIAWFNLYSRKELENIEIGIEVGAIQQWINSPPPTAKSLFDCLLPFEKKSILKWIEDNKAVWQEFVAGSSKPHCYRQYRWPDERDERSLYTIDIWRVHSLKKLARLGIWRSRIDIKQGRARQGFDDCLAVARAGRQWHGKETIGEQLVGLAISALAHEEILYITASQNFSAPDLEQLQQQLLQIYPEGYPLINMEGERLRFQDAVQRTFTEGGPGGGHLIPQRTHLLKGLYDIAEEIAEDIPVGKRFLESAALTSICLLHARRDATIAMGRQIYDKQAKIVRMSPYERHAGNLSSSDDILSSVPKYRYLLLDYLNPSAAAERVSEQVYQVKALHELTVAILALQRWRLEKNEYPAGLNDLVLAGFLKELPMDPYSDKPLVYKKTDDNFILYSLGCDFKDDGGKIVEKSGDVQKWGTHDDGDAVFWPLPESQVKQ